jgi:hypothetical protein
MGSEGKGKVVWVGVIWGFPKTHFAILLSNLSNPVHLCVFSMLTYPFFIFFTFSTFSCLSSASFPFFLFFSFLSDYLSKSFNQQH